MAVVAAAVAVGRVAGCAPFVEGAVDADGVDVFHDEVGAGGVFFEVEVLAVERDGDGVVGVELADEIARFGEEVEGILVAVGSVDC